MSNPILPALAAALLSWFGDSAVGQAPADPPAPTAESIAQEDSSAPLSGRQEPTPAEPAPAAPSEAPGPQEEPEPAWTPPPPGEAARRLQKEFERLHTSLRNNFGLRQEDVAGVNDFRDRVSAALAGHPDDLHLIALDAQVSMWLKDNDRVQAGFEQLIEKSGQATRYGEAWLRYLRTQNDEEHLARAFEVLLALAPDHQPFNLMWAEHLKQTGRFAQAIDVLQQLQWDPATQPETALILVEVLMGDQRFSEAVETVDLVPKSALEGKAALSSRLDQLKTQASQCVETWAREQEVRSAEAAADDLPQVELVTDKGRIVLELFEDQAPNTVANFISLVEDGYYNGTMFYRHAPGSLIEGGDRTAPETGAAPGSSDPGYQIPDEHTREGARQHFSGTVGMAKGGGPDTAGARFYLAFKPLPERNGRFTVFGRITEGMDVALALRKDDVLRSAAILRKRDHEYQVQTLPLPKAAGPGTAPAPQPVPVVPVPPPQEPPAQTPPAQTPPAQTPPASPPGP